MATLIQNVLNTTVNDNTLQFQSASGTGWSVSATGVTLTPSAGTSMPAIYVFQIDAPSSYNFTGGSGMNWGSSGNATYGIVSYEEQAYLVAIDNVTSLTTSGTFTLTVTQTQTVAGSSSLPATLDPTVSFNPPG